jgi:hypothetical protein
MFSHLVTTRSAHRIAPAPLRCRSKSDHPDSSLRRLWQIAQFIKQAGKPLAFLRKPARIFALPLDSEGDLSRPEGDGSR